MYLQAKKTYVRRGGLFSIQDANVVVEEKPKGKLIAGKIDSGASSTVRSEPSFRVCSICHKPGHNARTHEKDQEMSNVYSSAQFYWISIDVIM